jgi:urea transporter
MKLPPTTYMRPILVGILGMIAAVAVSKGYDYIFPADRGPFNIVILVIPWIIATVSAANLGCRTGIENQKNKK